MATQPDTEFDDAFAQFTDPKAADPATPEPDPAPAEPDPAPAVEPDPAPATPDPAPGEPQPDPEPAAEPEPTPEPDPAPAPSVDGDDILKRLSALVKEAPGAPDPAPAQPTADHQEEQLYTDEEQKILAAYEEDWPEVAKAEALRRRAEYRELASVIFQEMGKYIAPINELVTELATRTHLGDLQERVPDYEDLRDGVVSWVETQPAWLQPAYKNVMQQGTADEVADLINRYRAETGKAAPAAQPAPNGGELPPAAKKAARSMAPVTTKRTAMPQGEDPNDFDAAFAKFAAQTT